MINDFQHRLRQAITDRNITASELSRISGVGKSDISNYLNGVYVAKQDKCYMLAKALNVDPGWLMTGDAPAADPDAQFSRFITSYNSLPPAGKDYLQQQLRVAQVMFSEHPTEFNKEE